MRSKPPINSCRSGFEKGQAHSEGAAADTVLAEHLGSIGRRKVFPKSTIDDDDINGFAAVRSSHQRWQTDPRLTLTFRQRGLAGSASNRRDAAFRYAGNSRALREVAFAPFGDRLEL